MNKQQGMVIVEGLRQAQVAGAAVVELKGDDARNFNWAAVSVREELLGSFCVEIGRKFYVLIASTPRSSEDFQFMVYEKVKGSPILTTKSANTGGVVWTYLPTKQDAHNEARKEAFLEAAKAKSLTIPMPDQDLDGFSAAVNRAIELRRLADAAGGTGDEADNEAGSDASNIFEKLYDTKADREAAALLLARSIRSAHAHNPKSWCVTNPGGVEKVRLNVGVLRVLDLVHGQVKLIVDPEKVDAAMRAALGSAFELGDPKAKIAYAKIVVAASDVDALTDGLRDAHEAVIARAAISSSPFAGLHHQPAIIAAVEAVIGEQLPKPAAPQARYWKIAPGENGEQWDECRTGGFIAIGWNSLGDLTGIDHAEFKQREEKERASPQVWKFRNIEVGDRIVANAGTKRVLGLGTVTGPYYYVAGAKHSHRLSVQWDDITERTVEMKGWVKTLIRLPADVFKQIESAPSSATGDAKAKTTKETDPDGGLDFEDILDRLADKSLSFSAELVASYLLALQAKRFVLLTGISGTGKTRLAQEVARMFGSNVEQASTTNADAFELVSKPYQGKYSRFIVPAELAQEFDMLTNSEVKRIDLQVPGLPRASMAVNKNPDGGSLLQVLLSGDVRAWFKSNVKVGDRFVLSRQTSEDHEWLDLRLPDVGARSSRPGGATYEMIPVRPDWTDKSAILGFYNPLTKAYVSTPILQLLLRAHADVSASSEAAPPRPYFLIFDEMNLARVEHYFSDFLSTMESGEAIPLHDDVELEDAAGIPRRITIPRNVFVIGTVNVDETTYMFSPKVLDRAFVLEFNDVDLDGIGHTVPAEDPQSTPLALVNLDGLELRGPATDGEWQRFEGVLNGELNAILRKLHAALATENRHFGYRVAREVARFVDLAMVQTDGKDAAARAAFDMAVFAKILPKLHGSQAEMEGILKQLMSIAIGGKPEADVFHEGALRADATSVIPLPQTARKLWRMQRRLRARGFVSFIE